MRYLRRANARNLGIDHAVGCIVASGGGSTEGILQRLATLTKISMKRLTGFTGSQREARITLVLFSGNRQQRKGWHDRVKETFPEFSRSIRSGMYSRLLFSF